MWFLVMIVHHIVAWGLGVASLLSVLYQPWYMAFLMVIVVARIGTSRDKCILTELENKLREKSGRDPLEGGFIKHYYLRKFK